MTGGNSIAENPLPKRLSFAVAQEPQNAFPMVGFTEEHMAGDIREDGSGGKPEIAGAGGNIGAMCEVGTVGETGRNGGGVMARGVPSPELGNEPSGEADRSLPKGKNSPLTS